jgi:serine/threonine protein kinase
MSWFPQVGDTVGRYRITDVLGQGGMAVVFAAVAPDLERPVALKVLAPQAAVDARSRERFAHEAATLARLDSPHIVYILEYGEQDGCLYLVTQLVPGGDLRRYLDEHGPLSLRQAADVMEQVAAALEEAHSQGVVHRDLKSANVLLRKLPGGRFHAYLGDFGIARADTYETTSSAGVLGTLEYLAPERQSGAPASFATDVYSLGCLLWAAVTGAPPYRGSDVDVAVAHLRAPIPRLPGDDPVSRRTNAIVARAMAKKPDDRYPSAHEMRQELVALAALAAEHEEQLAGSHTSHRRRRRVAPLAALAGVASVVAVVAATAWLPPGASDSDPSDPPSSPGVAADSSEAPAAEATRKRRCWNGQVREPAKCPTPTGLKGLLWAYPTFKEEYADHECKLIRRPQAKRRKLAYFCPFTADNPGLGVRYSEWESAAAAREVISDDFGDFFQPEMDVEREGYTWSVWIRDIADENKRFSSAVAYRDWPFSVELETNNRPAAIRGCNLIELRAPMTFHLVDSLCESST